MAATTGHANGHTNGRSNGNTASTNGTTTASAAVDTNNLFIPLIDLTALLSPSASTTSRKSVATEILQGFRTSGFIYLKNHGIPSTTIARTFATSAKFYTRSQAEKVAMKWTLAEANRGYSGMGREKTSQAADAGKVAEVREMEGQDLKESFEIGNERDGETDARLVNRWPNLAEADGSEFRSVMLEFWELCKVLHEQVMRALALGLGIEETWFDRFTDYGCNTLRLLHYPGVAKSVFSAKKGQVRAGAHSDYGSITLLFQDQRGGLQVKSPSGEYVDATPIPGTIVVNAGDLLARWSNDYIKSTIHRVVEPPAPLEGDEHPARYSIAYFCNPDFDEEIDVIPGTMKEGEVKKYEPVNSGEYLVRRLNATY